MFPLSPYLISEISKIYSQERIEEARIQRLLNQAGIRRENWMSRTGCRILCFLGHQMVSLGKRLERLEIKPSNQPLVSRDGTEQNGFTFTRP
jgi:hypothetical protein